MVELRNYRESDIDTLAALANNQLVSRYLIYTFPYPYSKKDAEYWIKQGSKENGSTTKVICFNNLFVGSVGITPQVGWRDHCAEIGYWIGEEFWGKGIATRALEIMTEEAFEVHGFKKLFAPVLGPNVASMKVLMKCGYVSEGMLKNEVAKNNRYFDIHLYAKQRL